jgi:hypothetical protein
VPELVAEFSLTEYLTDIKLSRVTWIPENQKVPEEWRVGEALAEAYLVAHRTCKFPWPDGRDARKAGSSLPGADLVGFQQHGGTDRFAFGEVKTSGEIRYPPGAMYVFHENFTQTLFLSSFVRATLSKILTS